MGCCRVKFGLKKKKRSVGEIEKLRDPQEGREKQLGSKNNKPSGNTPHIKCWSSVQHLFSPELHLPEVDNVLIPILHMKTPKQWGEALNKLLTERRFEPESGSRPEMNFPNSAPFLFCKNRLVGRAWRIYLVLGKLWLQIDRSLNLWVTVFFSGNDDFSGILWNSNEIMYLHINAK